MPYHTIYCAYCLWPCERWGSGVETEYLMSTNYETLHCVIFATSCYFPSPMFKISKGHKLQLREQFNELTTLWNGQ
jgi:hypothetical protein